MIVWQRRREWIEKRGTSGSKREAEEEEMSELTSEFASWLTELMVMLLKEKGSC